MPKKNEAPASFETALGELEQIVNRLESGDLPLEEALSEFERGVQLARLLGSDICSEEEAGKDVIFRDFGWIGTPTETRYVRFHAIQGKKQFLFTDEIVIQ